MTPVQQEILAIERQFWSGDEVFFRAHTDERCLVAFPSMSGVMTREDMAATARNPNRWRDLDIRLKGIVQPSDDVVAMTYEATATRENGDPYRALVSSGYINRADGWKLMFHAHAPTGSGG